MDELRRLAGDVESRVGQMSKGDVAEPPEKKEKEKEAKEMEAEAAEKPMETEEPATVGVLVTGDQPTTN